MSTPFPPTVHGPLIPSSVAVMVTGVMPDADVTVFADGTSVGTAHSTQPGSLSVPLSVKLAIDQNERGNVVYARYLLAEIHSLERPVRADAAEKHYHDALTLGTKLGMRPLVARCNAGLGTLRMRLGKPREAERPLITARAMYRSMGMRFWLDKLDTDVMALA